MTVNDTAAGTTHVPRPGATARRTRAVTARDIELFTELSGDRNPIHWDDDLASASRFGGVRLCLAGCRARHGGCLS